jgi:hypothetical protein
MPKNAQQTLLEEIGALTSDGDAPPDDSDADDLDDDTGPLEDGSNQERFNSDEPTDDELDHDPNEDEGEDEDDDDEDDNLEGDDRDIRDELAERANRQQSSTKQKQRQRQDDSTSPFDPRAKVQPDKRGNLYIAGRKVASAGEPARIYMAWRKQAKDLLAGGIAANKQLVNVANASKELLGRYEALVATKGMFDKAGLTVQEQSQMLELALAYKKNPIDGIKLMLTRAHLGGVDIKSLGVGGGIDPKALMDEMKGFMEAQLKPLHTQTSQNARREALRQEAEGFFERNPAAQDVANLVGGSHKLALILKGAKQQSPDLSLDELFQKLHYQLLVRNNGRLPTGPVDGQRRQTRTEQRRVHRKMDKNLQRSISSIDDIGASVLRDVRAIVPRGV